MVERLFYPLAMLAERWGCAVDDLLHLGLQGEAQISANLNQLPGDVAKTYSFGFDGEQAAHGGRVGLWRMFRAPAKSGSEGIYFLGVDYLRRIVAPNFSTIKLSSAMAFDSAHVAWHRIEFREPFEITLAHLCILHDEAERLGREVFGTTPPPVAEVDAPQDDDPSDLPFELDTALIAYRAVSNNYGDQENSFKIRLEAYLHENYPDLSKEAFGRIATVANADKSPGRKGARRK